MSNGGEALCSRPTSFNFDAAYSNHESLQKFEACASELDLLNEIPRNFAEIYGEIIDDPFQNSAAAAARQQSSASSAKYLQALNHYNTPEEQKLKSQRTPILSRSVLEQRPFPTASVVRRSPSASDGSNDTLCPNGDNEPEDQQRPPPPPPACHASPKQEIIVNMVRTLTMDADFARIFRNPSSRLTKLLSADDGYSTMSDQSYLEYLFNPSTKSVSDRMLTTLDEKSIQTNRFPGNFQKSFSDDLLWISDFYSLQKSPKINEFKKFLSDSQLNFTNLPKNCDAKRLLRRFSKRAEKNFFPFLSNGAKDFLSSRNDLTEFERDMLLYQDEEDKREALFELDDETKVG